MRNIPPAAARLDEAGQHPITLGSPDDLVAVVPYLVGFPPRESLVMVGVEGVNVRVTARLDLLDCGDPELRHAISVVARSGADAVLALAYCDHVPALRSGAGEPGAHMFDPVRRLCDEFRLTLGECLIVHDDRYWRFGHRSASERVPRDSLLAAEATFAGMVLHRDRESLLSLLDRDEDILDSALITRLADRQAAFAASLHGNDGVRERRSVKRAIFAAARHADTAVGPVRGDEGRLEQLCRFAVGLRDVEVRDAVWLAIDERRLVGRGLWQELLRRLPAPYDASPLFLFGWGCWRDGNGVLASEAAARALASDPDYTAAELLRSAVDAGLDPRRTPRLRPGREHKNTGRPGRPRLRAAIPGTGPAAPRAPERRRDP